MDSPHAPPASVAQTAATFTYLDSLSSSHHSRAADFDDLPLPQPHQPTQQQPPPPQPPQKLRLMCSYNGHIIPRPHTKSLCYVGGETRMITLERGTTLSDFLTRLSKTLISNPNPNKKTFILKYQLPGEDLDSLISVSHDDDLDNMIDECDRLNSGSSGGRPSRIRLFLFPVKPDGAQSMGPILDGSDDWFLNALNGSGCGLQRGFSDPGEVNCLIGLDHDVEIVNPNSNPNPNPNPSPNFISDELKVELKKVGNNQDVQSVSESKTSSFGSTSSTPTLGNLPPIKAEGDSGIEGQFGKLGLGVSGGQLQKGGDEGLVVISTQPNSGLVNGFSGVVSGGGEFANRVYSDDGYQQQMGNGGGGGGVMSSQIQQKQQFGGGSDLPSPDSVSSDTSLSGAMARQNPVIYQDANGQLSSESNRFPAGIQVQQVSGSGYQMHPQYELHHQVILQPHPQQKLHEQQKFVPQQQFLQQQQAQTPSQTQQQQYIPAGAHFVHHPPPGAVPMPAYYHPIYPPQQPPNHPHQYPVYYVPAPGYSLPGQQQSNFSEAPTSVPSNRTQAPLNPTIITSAYNPTGNINMEPPKSEIPNVYGTTNGYCQIQQPSQSVAYDTTQSQMHYAQPQGPTLASQYQGGPTMMMPEGNDSVKQQIRSSQPL